MGKNVAKVKPDANRFGNKNTEPCRLGALKFVPGCGITRRAYAVDNTRSGHSRMRNAKSVVLLLPMSL